MYELSVAWNHGESGGPVCVAEPLAAISLMQEYRTVDTDRGVIPGPRRGVMLSVVKDQLEEIGATVVRLT